jgi:hypothetical protein
MNCAADALQYDVQSRQLIDSSEFSEAAVEIHDGLISVQLALWFIQIGMNGSITRIAL